MDKIVKNALKELSFGVIYLVLIVVINIYFKLSTWGLIGLLVFGSVVIGFISKQPFKIKNFLKVSLIIALFVWGFKFLSRFGWKGYIFGIVLSCGYILYNRREKYFKTKHYIETMIWGKPLYKYREEGKKPPKISIGI